MSARSKLVIGEKYHLLTVVKEVGTNKHYKRIIECLCECGTVTNVLLNSLKTGHTKSCGCLNLKKFKERATRHNGCGTRIHSIWRGIISRCEQITHISYPNYGGRGINICDEWRGDFSAFRSWANKNGYSDSKSIDRIDPNGNYVPSNCRWIPIRLQGRNKRNTIMINHNGIDITLIELSEKLGVPYISLYKKYRRGELICA